MPVLNMHVSFLSKKQKSKWRKVTNAYNKIEVH